jgi:MSHA biogenesis protein MshO
MKRQSGFTLIEAIVVIVLTGILVGAVVVFMKIPVQAYVDSTTRADLTDTADVALRRIAREARRALPNSVRVSADGRTVEFYPTKTGGRYLSDDDGAGTPYLNFYNSSQLTFTVLGQMPSPAITPGEDSIVLYNLGQGIDKADAYAGGNITAITAVTGNVVTMASNPFAANASAGQAVLASPSKRFYVVTTPVSYVCNLTTRTVTRYSGYAATAIMVSPPTGSGMTAALLANDVSACSFTYDSSVANTRTGLLRVSLTLQRSGSQDGPITLFHQIHVDNPI